MNPKNGQPEYREDIIHELRTLTERGTSVRELVRTVQGKLGLPAESYLEVLPYLTRAFRLHLRTVLPIREWIWVQNDKEIDAEILPAIEKAKPDWSQASEEAVETA